jgi:hypothetical protein
LQSAFSAQPLTQIKIATHKMTLKFSASMPRVAGFNRSRFTHRHADILRARGRGVVDTVVIDGDDLAGLTGRSDNLQLLAPCHTSEQAATHARDQQFSQDVR